MKPRRNFDVMFLVLVRQDSMPNEEVKDNAAMSRREFSFLQSSLYLID